MNAVPLTAGGTGATSASGAMANLLPGVASDGNNGITVTGGVSASGYKVGGSAFGTANLADWTNSGVASGLCAVWNGTTGKWTPGSCGSGGASYAGVTSPGTGGLQGNPGAGQTWEITPAGSSLLQQSITALSPVCDIRSQGAIIDGATPIDSAMQACVNLVSSQYGATGTVLLPCVQKNGTGAGCFWANPSALGSPVAGTVKFLLQGSIQLGSTLVGYGFENWYGDGGGSALQFLAGNPGTFLGPQCWGTLGTAITAANTATTITPTVTGSNCSSVANLPVGSAITIAANTSSTATAARVTSGSLGQVTLVTASAIRIPQGALINVSGCSDSSFNSTNNIVISSDFPAQQIAYFQADTTPSTATGCTVTGFNDDSYESARILCSNGTGGTFNGVTYNSCSTGTVTIMTKRTHLSTDSFGEVAVGPAFNIYVPQTWSDLSIVNPSGMGFWAEGSTNLTMNHVGVQAAAGMVSGAAELSANYLSNLHGVFFQATDTPTCGSNGGCTAVSNPYSLICDSDAAVGGYYNATVSACDATNIDEGSWFTGGIKLGDGTQQILAMPTITSATDEWPRSSVITIDNRQGISAGNTMVLDNLYPQDNITHVPVYLFRYTDNEAPTGSVDVRNFDVALNSYLTNNYFNGSLSVNGIAQGTIAAIPLYLNAPSGAYNEGGRIKAEIENEGASFGPQIVPYGSLPMTSYSVSAWSALCVTAGTCTVSAVAGPDGPNGQMVAAEMDTSQLIARIQIGWDAAPFYSGDHFIIWSWVRPGLNQGNTRGVIGGEIGAENAFNLNAIGGGAFAPSAQNGGNTATCAPGAFGTQLANNGWGLQAAICTLITGDSTGIEFFLNASNGGSGTSGNQFAEPGWAFIPGPNNPACTAAGTCNLSADQIEEARRDQYHGFVPPGMSAGTAATGETVSANGYKVNGTALNAPNETYNASASGSITLPSADRAEATYVLSGNVTASISAGTGGGKVTIFVCQPASGGPYTWAWPASWKGGVTVGTTASTCSEQTGTYIAGLGDWHGDAGSTNVPQ